ncbi:MAG: LexA family protein [Brevinematia bacterium]
MWNDLSPKQSKTLEFIMEYIKKYSIPPTYQEIAKNQKITIKSVAQRIEQLKKKGYIEVKKNTPRGITLTEKSSFNISKQVYVNVFSEVKKFKKYFKLNNLEKTVPLPISLFTDEDTTDPNKIFLLKINEKSNFSNYLDIDISQNDYLLILRTSEINENDNVLCIYEDRTISGKISKFEKFFVVKAKNSTIPIGSSNATLIGKIIGIIKVIR